MKKTENGGSVDNLKDKILKAVGYTKILGGNINFIHFAKSLYENLIKLKDFCNDNFSQNDKSIGGTYYGSTQMFSSQRGKAITLSFNDTHFGNYYAGSIPYVVQIQVGGSLDYTTSQAILLASKLILEKYSYENPFGKGIIKQTDGTNWSSVLLSSPTNNNSYYTIEYFNNKFAKGGSIKNGYAIMQGDKLRTDAFSRVEFFETIEKALFKMSHVPRFKSLTKEEKIKLIIPYTNQFKKGGMVEYHDYKGVEIMYEPTYEEYFVNDLVFNSLEKAHKYIDSGEANETPTYIQNLYRRGAMAKGGSVKNGYMVFNYTDNLYATNEVFQTKNDAKRFIDEFKKRFVLQGYYRDSNMNKIDINDIDLYVLDADFNPYKFSEGGIVTYANLDLNTNRNIIAKAIEFISGTGVDAESMTLEGKEIRFKYRTSNTYTTISQKLISDTISTNRKSLELRGKNFATGGMIKGGKVLASSSTKEGIIKLIAQYLYGSTITLIETDNDKIYEVHNKKGKTSFYVEFSRGKYRFIQPSMFANGGSIENKNKLWYEVLQKFFKIFYGEYEDDTAEKHIKDSQVTTDQAKYYYENFMDKYKTERTLSDGFKIFKQSLTKEELDSIQISFNSEDYADAEEHDTQKRYSTITIKKKENFKKGGSVIDEQVYIDYMNKEKGFKRDRIYFDSYAEAVEWGRKNFEKFNTDMINYV